MKIILLLSLLVVSAYSVLVSRQTQSLRKDQGKSVFANFHDSDVVGNNANDSNAYPLPFTRELSVKTPLMEGSDVYILQNLLARFASVNVTRKFDASTSNALKAYQSANSLLINGKLDENTANSIMKSKLIKDNFKYTGFTAASMGYQYLIHIPVRSNRSIETIGTLYDANGKQMMTFHARLHGVKAAGIGHWCESSNVGSINQFSSNGDTPTGLSAIDYQTPFSDTTHYGKYPVHRIVKGLKGNAAFLMHTGEWSTHCSWDKLKPMPNSLGCIHVWPEEMGLMEDIMKKMLKIQPTTNSNGRIPFPYKPRGLLAIELVD